MALVSGRGSTLNPNAPPFIPAVYRQVEDFSSEWWNLVQNSAWFRDYWLSEHQEASFEGFSDPKDDDITNLLPDTFDVDYDDEFPCADAEFEEMIGSFGRGTYENSGFRTEMKAQDGVRLRTFDSPYPARWQEPPPRRYWGNVDVGVKGFNRNNLYGIRFDEESELVLVIIKRKGYERHGGTCQV